MKSRQKISFVCQECGYDSPSWLGKCPECGAWASLKEIHLGSYVSKASSLIGATDIKPEKLQDITVSSQQRLQTGFSEMDTVLGGGIVKGSVTLVAGDPGIGKSTLLLQLCMNLSGRGEKVLYISGEESKEQVSMRAKRIDSTNTLGSENLLLVSLTNTDAIGEIITQQKPSFVVVDSIQTLESEHVAGLSGAVGQIRYATGSLIKIAKTQAIPIFLVGHVTKEGMVAGPMVLSHMVDTVLFLEGEKYTKTRLLRGLKNRFGPVDEVGVFIMDGEGMAEVKNPEQIFLSEKKESVPGSVLVVIMEGSRPFLVEIQALVVSSKFPMPRRVASGVDSRRVELLLAVLQKHCRLPLEMMDVFVNIAGGIRVTDPAVDLGICLAIFSSLKNKELHKTVGIAEVGLLGELRNVANLEKRVREATKLGFETIITAKTHQSIKEVLLSI